ncbi:MAG: DoxX family protein [Bacteroidota bacterium]
MTKSLQLYRGLKWILSIIVALTFILAASGKFNPSGNMADNFERWGYTTTLMFIVGIAEGLGGLLLLIPKTRYWGVIILMPVMIGASITHLVHSTELGFPLLPIILILLLLTLRILNNKH